MIVQCYFCGTFNSVHGNLPEETLRNIFDGWVMFVQYHGLDGRCQPDKLEMLACPQCAVSPERRQSFLKHHGRKKPECRIIDRSLFTDSPGLVYAPYIPKLPAVSNSEHRK